MMDPPLVTPLTGAFQASSLVETVGVSEVDGFYRFPSFKSCKAERCQQDYSAMKTTGLKSKFAGIYATGTRGTRQHSIWLECDRSGAADWLRHCTCQRIPLAAPYSASCWAR